MDTVAGSLRIRGRSTELALLGEALDHTASGGSSILLIEGEAGIGKSRLLYEALQAARERGMHVAAGQATDLEQTRPFGLIADAFGCVRSSPDPRRTAIKELLRSGDKSKQNPITVTSDQGLRFRAVDAFIDLAEELALTGPLVIGMDDLQWADTSTLITLSALSRRLNYLPVILIGCMRPAPRVTELDRLITTMKAEGAHQLVLRSLSEAEVTELVTEAVGAEPGPALMTEVAGAAGNPLFVTELLAALTQEAAIKVTDGQADLVVAMALPPTLRLTILRRISFLSESSLDTLRVASILGPNFSLTDLATVMDAPALELSANLTEALRAHVIEDDGAHLHFRHALIRDAIYEDLLESVRRALHREAGKRLAKSGAGALQVAEHLARGAGVGDADAVTWLTRAARDAAASSPDVAAGLIQRAMDLMDPADPMRDQLIVERANSLMLAGQVTTAEHACHDLLDREHDPRAEGAAQICLGQALLVAGRPLEGLDVLERAIESPALTNVERSSALGLSSTGYRWLGDLERSAAAAEKAHTVALASGDHLTITVALVSMAIVFELRGRLREALRIIDDAVRVADESPEKKGHGYPVLANRAFILVELDQFDEADRSVEAERRTSEDLGLGWHLASIQMTRIAKCFFAGEWDDAIAEVDANIELANETGQALGLTLGSSVLSLVALHRGDLIGAKGAAISADAGRTQTRGGQYRGQLATLARALVWEAEGDVDQALTGLSECWDRCTELGLGLEYPILGPDVVRLALASGDRGRAYAAAEAVAEIAKANQDVPSIVGASLRCKGLVEDDAAVLCDAAGLYAKGPRPLDLALTCEEAGGTFLRHGLKDSVEPLIDRAVQIYEQLGATRDLARAEALMRAAGIRRGRRGARGRPKIGWPSLTPTEHTIALLVAEGLSNPQIGGRLFVSRRTVQTHLAHIFAKLDITSRAQLAAEVSKH